MIARRADGNAAQREPGLGLRIGSEPDNPYVAVFAPLIIASDAELSERAPSFWQTIQQATLDDETRATLSKATGVLVF
jgi:hypothetical protein